MSGKWDLPGFPKKGWTCVEIEDLGGVDAVCNMCEVMPIRFVHTMEHIVGGRLEVGCICAGHMEENISAARGREAMMKKRANFARRKSWTGDAVNGWRIETGGLRLVVFPHQKVWRVSVVRASGKVLHGSKRYPTEDAAKKGAFDAMLHVKGSGQRPSP